MQLYNPFLTTSPHAEAIHHALCARLSTPPVLDHFALISLPGEHTGIPMLKRLFNQLGYEERGHDYLPDKQNDFMWLAPVSNQQAKAAHALPQVVIADFRLDEMPSAVATIIHHYAKQAKPSDTLVTHPWPRPTIAEYETVRAFNELLAWVLVWGHQPNHFGLSMHLQSHFPSLEAFNHYLEHELAVPLNQEGGTIKGTLDRGIMQSSTQAPLTAIQLADGVIEINEPFMEFVWRKALADVPAYWHDYYQDFIGAQANKVVESLYLTPFASS